MQKTTLIPKINFFKSSYKNLDFQVKDSLFDFNASKESNPNEGNMRKSKGQLSSLIPTNQFISRFESINIDQNNNLDEQDTMVEQYNRIDVHDLDKWLDFNKSRLSKISNLIY